MNRTYLTWVSKNKNTFMMVALLIGNVYQYMDRKVLEEEYKTDQKLRQGEIEKTTKEAIDYERQRSERYEILLNNLSKSK